MPRLPKGMYRRGKAYYVRVQRPGRDTRRSLGTNFEEAVRAYRRLTLRPHLLEAPRITVAAAIERWLETAIATRRIESGRKDTASRVRRYVVPVMGEWMLSEVGPDDVLQFRARLEQDGHGVAMVHRVLSDFRSFLRWAALEARLVGEAPVPRRLLPRLQQSFPKRLTDEEVERVCGIPEPYGFVIRFALATGLRWGELTRSKASDIERGVLHVAQTKSGKVRRVPLTNAIFQEVADRTGRLVPYTHPGMFARRVREHSGVERFHMHMTRHTFACRWVEAGGNLAVLQAVLGHSSILVTQRYAHLSDEAVALEMKRIAGQTGTETGTVRISRRRHGPVSRTATQR
jgi:integrase